MSLRSAALAGLLLLGTASAMVSVSANAATQACGSTCVSLMPEKYGVADFMAAGQGFVSMRGSGSGVGQPVILAASGQVASEDWHVQYLGTAAELGADGLVTSVVGRNWPAAPAYEYSYTPDGRFTGLCLGVSGPAGLGTPVTLQTCGTPFDTVWIKISRSLDDYGPLVSGTDTGVIAPYVLTAGEPGGNLVTGYLVPVGSRTPSPDQMWRNWTGPY
jgi:hypothetical protein